MYRDDIGAGFIRRFLLPKTTVANASGAIDFFELTVPAGLYYELRKIRLCFAGDPGDAEAEQIHVEIKRATSGFTSGSGGANSALTPRRTGDGSPGVNAEVFNTTQAVAGTGTLITLEEEAFTGQAGYLHAPLLDELLGFNAGEAIIFSLETAVADDVAMAGHVLIVEHRVGM